MFLVSQRVLYNVGLIQLWIPTPGFNQSSWNESGKYSSSICLSVWLVGSNCSLLIRGLQLVMVVSHLEMKSIILTPRQVGPGSTQASMFYFLSKKCNRPISFAHIFVDFVSDSTTFVAQLRVIKSVTKSVPVEHTH